MEHKEYNGWTNWDTWVTVVWVDNERDLNDKKESISKSANKYKLKGKYDEKKLRKAFNRLAKMGALRARKNGDEVKNKEVNWKEIEDNFISSIEEY